MKRNICLLVVFALVLLAWGCGKKKMTVADLPPDPKGCEVFVFDKDSTTWPEDQQKMAEMGCLRKLDQWLKWDSDEESPWDANYLKLLAASIAGNTEEVKKMLASGVDVNEVEGMAWNYTVSYGHPEIIKEFLKKGTKELLKDDARLLFFCFADPYFFLKGSVGSDQALLEILHALVKEGFDVNQRKGECGASLWPWPRSNNRTLVTQELEKLGFKVTQEDKNMALFIAAAVRKADGTRGNVEIVKGLIREGADVNGKASRCSTGTIYEAVKKNGTPEMIELFKSYGAHD